MRKQMEWGIGRVLGRMMFVMICAVLLAGATFAQNGGGSGSSGGSCTVTQLRLRFATSNDDLRGGHDNLNIVIYFTTGGYQLAPNVNKSQNWPNNSVNVVAVPLAHPVPPSEIRAFRLVHIADGGFNIGSLPELATLAAPIAIAQAFQSPDNWDMADVQVAAVGNGVGARIAQYGYYRFTGSNPALTISFNPSVLASACGTGRPSGNNGGSGSPGSGLNPGLNPGGSGLHSVTGGASAGSPYARNLTGVIARPLAQGSTQPWQKNRMVTLALARAIPVGPKPSAPGGPGNGSNNAAIAVLQRQSAAARPLLSPAFTPGAPPVGAQTGAPTGGTLLPSGANQNPTLLNGTGGASQSGAMLNGGTAKADDLSPQPYPPKGSAAQVGPSQTMSAQSSMPVGTATSSQTSATALAPNGPQRQNPAGGQHPTPSIVTRAATARQAQTQVCINGIGSVDGQKSGVVFSPIAGAEGTFVIQGCAFGTTPGQVYLSGVHYPNGRAMYHPLGVAMGQVSFQIPANGWSDRQITAQIDANASGLYDTNNVTLVVKTASGQIYQAGGFTFAAAYDFQTLTTVPQSPSAITIQLAKVNDSSGGSVLPLYETPWIYSTPQHTLGVNRNRVSFTLPGSYTFPGGTDSYQFHFAPGFRLANNGVQLYHFDLTAADCSTSPNGQFSTNGTWGVNYTSPTSVQISWQEQGCWPTSNPGNALDYASVSVYSLWITVWGPRGVSPW